MFRHQTLDSSRNRSYKCFIAQAHTSFQVLLKSLFLPVIVKPHSLNEFKLKYFKTDCGVHLTLVFQIHMLSFQDSF